MRSACISSHDCHISFIRDAYRVRTQKWMMSVTETAVSNHHEEGSTGSPGEVFMNFLRLGLTSFGGPIAHLGYFRDEIVVRRKWLTEEAMLI